MPIPTLYIAPRPPAATANGTAISVMTSVTNGNEMFAFKGDQLTAYVKTARLQLCGVLPELAAAHEPLVGRLGGEVRGRLDRRLRFREGQEG